MKSCCSYGRVFGPATPEDNRDLKIAREREQDYNEAMGFWECPCGFGNEKQRDTMVLRCSKCKKPRKFDLLRRQT